MISSPMLLVMPREARSAADLKTCQAKLMPYREKSVVRVFYGNLHLFRSLYTQGRLDEFTEQKYKAEVSTKYRERGSAFWKQILFQLPTFALAKAVFIEAGRPDLWQFWEKTSRDGAAMGIALELLDRDGHEPFLQTLNPNYRAK